MCAIKSLCAQLFYTDCEQITEMFLMMQGGAADVQTYLSLFYKAAFLFL